MVENQPNSVLIGSDERDGFSRCLGVTELLIGALGGAFCLLLIPGGLLVFDLALPFLLGLFV